MKIAFGLNVRPVTAACIILFIAFVIATAQLSPSHALTSQGVINIEKKIESMEAAGNKAVAVLEKSIISIDPDSGTFSVLAEFNKEVKAVSVDDTGSRLLVSLENEKDILILDLETGMLLKKIKAEEKPEAFCIDAVRNIAAVKLQGKGIIELINLSDMTVAKKIKIKEPLSGLWCDSEKELLLAASGAENEKAEDKGDYDDEERSEKEGDDSGKGRLYIITEKGERIAEHSFNKGIRDVSIDSDNTKAAVLTDDGNVYILDIDTQVLTLLTALQYFAGDIELKGEGLFVTDKESGNLITIDTSTGGILKEEYIGKKARHIACTDDYCLVSFKDGIRVLKGVGIAYPLITNAAVTDITTSSAMASWSTDLPADSFAEYGETASYGNTLSNPELTTAHNLTLTGLKPATTYHIKITSTNNYGFSSSSDAGSFTTLDPPPAINLNITYPADGAALSRADTMASGTIVNATGNETGVTVNGVVAVVYGNQFFVNHLPLVEGGNIITVNALDTAGNRADTSITVYADTTKPYVTLNSNTESGISPFDAYFSVDTAIPNSVSTYQMDGNYEGNFDIDYTGAAFDNVSFTYAYEGVYYPMILVTDSAGNGYTDTIAVVVQDRVELDALLQGKWGGMKAALANHNINTAVNTFTDDKQAHYIQLFNDIYAYLPQFVQDMQNIELIYAKDNMAKYRIRKNEVYAGQSYEIAYFIYFVLDENGIWKIDIF